ncbi:ABC transporter domain-containing protein OS=Streptomyces antimycoticus OX=68175 GN=SANT12839_083250 PE=4 SV=1 [Streptomyces antimycoticus]
MSGTRGTRDTNGTHGTPDTGAPGPLVEVEDLQIELITDRGVVRAVDGVGFTIDPGETVTIIGESGSGKSTTAMGLLRLLPDGLAVLSGTARIFGADVIADAKAAGRIRGRGVSLIPQDPMTALSPVHTIGRQLGEALRLRHPGMSRAEARAKGVELLGRVRIPHPETRWGAYPHQFSGGMLQRVLIAIALAAEPRLLVADEPTSALDVTVQAGVLDLLMELQEAHRHRHPDDHPRSGRGPAGLRPHPRHARRPLRGVGTGRTDRVTTPASGTPAICWPAVPTLGPWHETPAAVTEEAL